MTAIVSSMRGDRQALQPEPDKRERVRADEFVREDRSASTSWLRTLDQSANVV